MKKSFSFLLWQLWLTLHYNKIPKETHVKKSFSFLLWKLWLTLPNKKIPKETHVKNSFSFLLWILWLTLYTLVTFATKLFNILKVENSHLSNNTKKLPGYWFYQEELFFLKILGVNFLTIRIFCSLAVSQFLGRSHFEKIK